MCVVMFAEPSAELLASWFGINTMLMSEITHPAVGLSEGAQWRPFFFQLLLQICIFHCTQHNDVSQQKHRLNLFLW